MRSDAAGGMAQGVSVMSRVPGPLDRLIATWGPTLHALDASDGREPDRLVKTHCCFCGVQCGIQLKVKGRQVIGFEPWEEFPVNRGMLCPKGVQRYLQNSHPDRITTPLIRTADGFRKASWEEAMDRVVDNIRGIQRQYQKDAFAVLSGASITNEKAYLMGKFARVALGTRNIDYNGRLCMVSAGAANQKAFGVDRAANPWRDIPLAKCLILAGVNVAECFPVLTDYLWRARDRGARIIVIDPRMTPIARTADLLLPVKPGRDSALMNGLLHVCIRRRWIDEGFIARCTTGFEEVCRAVAPYTPRYTAGLTGVSASAIEKAAEWWATAPTGMLMHARGIEHHTRGVDNCLACINLVLATGKIGRPGCGYTTITGQGNGQGAREHGQRCNQLPGGRDIENLEHRRIVARRWGVDAGDLPGAGMPATAMMPAVLRGEIRGMLCMCFNPVVSLPDANTTRKALEALEFFCVIDFFMSETARHADVILPGSLQEEDEGTVTNAEGRVIRIRQAVTPPGRARQDWQIILDLAHRLCGREKFRFACVEDIYRELRVLSQGAVVDYYGITYDKIDALHGVFWPCPDRAHPGTPRLYENGKFYHADGKARFHAIDYQAPEEDVDEDYPLILTTGRVVSQFLSGTQTRRIAPLVQQQPEPLVELHVQLARQLNVSSGDLLRVVSRRGEVTLPCLVVRTIRPDTIFIPYHWPDHQSANLLTNPAVDPVSKIPAYKVCAVRVEACRNGAPAASVALRGRKGRDNIKSSTRAWRAPEAPCSLRDKP